MHRTRLVVVDSEKRSVTHASANSRIVYWCSKDPNTLDDFVAAEENRVAPSRFNFSFPIDVYEDMFWVLNSTYRTSHEVFRCTISDVRRANREFGKETVTQAVKVITDVIVAYDLDARTPLGEILPYCSVTYPLWNRESERRHDFKGGTVVVDLPRKILTVKGHLLRPDDGRLKEGQVACGRRVVCPENGEAWYDVWGLVSRLREGSVLGREDGRFATKEYRLPDTWKLKDGVLGKTY